MEFLPKASAELFSVVLHLLAHLIILLFYQTFSNSPEVF